MTADLLEWLHPQAVNIGDVDIVRALLSLVPRDFDDALGQVRFLSAPLYSNTPQWHRC